MLPIAVLSVILAAACAAPSHTYYHNRVGEAHVNHVNGLRQAYVNHIAENAGAGTGTADKYGVPGTYVHGNAHGHAYGHGYYGHGHGYGHPGYGYGVYPDQYNANRQQYVNNQAEAVGAGTGTYKKDGVPGTYLDKRYFH